MRSNLIAIILAVVVVGAFLVYYQGKSGSPQQPAPEAAQTVATTTGNQPAPSTATNYDECLAQGGSLLPTDSTKCLTKDGHVFIQGVTE